MLLPGVVIVLEVAAILIFFSGFFLHRHTLPDVSTCSNSPLKGASTESEQAHNSTAHCWLAQAPKFDKAVVLVIDALRYDFVIPSSDHDGKPFANKFTVLHELLDREPDNALMYRFLADPPTVTTQRLKGITTGSFPTFVDTSRQFFSSELMEDNFIAKLVTGDRTMAFAGDDTWQSLFPHAFNESYPFPSFNVRDLHTVDNGVKAHMDSLLSGGQHRLVLAHTLGVDHVGHRYSPNHPYMGTKLKEMDDFVRHIIKTIDDNTLFAVLGDHGMTDAGNHGGETESEVTSPLFLYSKSGLTSAEAIARLQQAHFTGNSAGKDGQTSKAPLLGNHRSVRQIDLACTLPTLLGAPIPFHSLGKCLIEPFLRPPIVAATGHRSVTGREDQDKPQELDDEEAAVAMLSLAVEAMRLNAHQIHRFSTKYATLHPESAPPTIRDAAAIFEEAEHAYLASLKISSTARDGDTVEGEAVPAGKFERLCAALHAYTMFISETQEMYRKAWTTFNIPTMVLGAVCSALVVAMLVIVTFSADAEAQTWQPKRALEASANKTHGHFSGASIYTWSGLMLGLIFGIAILTSVPAATSFLTNTATILGPACLGGSAGFFAWFWAQTANCVVRPDAFVTCLLVIAAVQAILSFSNSFIVNEDVILAGMLLVMAILRTAQALRYGQNKVRVVLAGCAFFGMIAISKTMRFCREEQDTCKEFFSAEWAASSSPSNLASLSVLAINLAVSFYLRWKDNLHGIALVRYKYILAPFVLLFSLEYAVEYLDGEIESGSLDRAQLPPYLLWIVSPDVRVFWPRMTMVTSLLTLAWCYLSGRVVQIGTRKVPVGGNGSRDETFVVGIPTQVSSLLLIGACALLDVMMQVTPAQWLVSYLYLVATATAYLALLIEESRARYLYGLQKERSDSQLKIIRDRQKTKAAVVTTYQRHVEQAVRAIREHFAHPSLADALVWATLAYHFYYFTGHQETLSAIRWSAGIVGLSDMIPLFSGFFIWMETFGPCALFAFSTFMLMAVPLTATASSAPHEENTGDFALFTTLKSKTQRRARALASMFGLVVSLRICCSIISALVLRRHLMVWKIFAPRLFFECCIGITCLVFLLLGEAYFKRVGAHTKALSMAIVDLAAKER